MQTAKPLNYLLLSILLIVAFNFIYRNHSPHTNLQDKKSQTASINQQWANKSLTDSEDPSLRQSDAESLEINSEIKNILILGRAGANYPGGNLTDTIIIAHFQPEANKAFLISVPRDLLVQIPQNQNLAKINALCNLVGIKNLEGKITEITGLTIDRYFVIDLTATQEIIDLIDGLNVYVPENIYDPHFPGPHYVYDPFILEAGWRYLDGRNVLRYIRTRYTSPNGDFDRMSRQQQIIRLLKQKVLDLNPLWDFPKYVQIFNTLRNNIETDLSILELKDIWSMAQQAKSDRIATIVIDKKESNLLTSGTISLGQTAASVVWPKAGRNNYSEIKEYISEIIK